MVIFQILLLNDKRVISKEQNTVRASNLRASLTWTDNTSKVGYAVFICLTQNERSFILCKICFLFPFINVIMPTFFFLQFLYC